MLSDEFGTDSFYDDRHDRGFDSMRDTVTKKPQAGEFARAARESEEERRRDAAQFGGRPLRERSNERRVPPPAPAQIARLPPRDPKTLKDAPPAVGEIVSGLVARITNFGCFVQLEGYRRDGLVHISQISNTRVSDVNDAVAVELPVWVKVIEVSPGDGLCCDWN